jgi:hypothetical protein
MATIGTTGRMMTLDASLATQSTRQCCAAGVEALSQAALLQSQPSAQALYPLP